MAADLLLGYYNRASPGDKVKGEQALRAGEQENYVCPLLSAIFCELARTVY